MTAIRKPHLVGYRFSSNIIGHRGFMFRIRKLAENNGIKNPIIKFRKAGHITRSDPAGAIGIYVAVVPEHQIIAQHAIDVLENGASFVQARVKRGKVIMQGVD